MKRISYLFSLLFLMTFVAFTSCKPDEETVPVEKQNADLLADTYTVTSVTRSDDAPVDLSGQTVTLTFGANDAGTGGTFGSTNAAVLPGNTDLPATGTWEWPNLTTFNRVIVNPGAITLNLTSALDADPLVFTYSGEDEKGAFTATVTADRN